MRVIEVKQPAGIKMNIARKIVTSLKIGSWDLFDRTSPKKTTSFDGGEFRVYSDGSTLKCHGAIIEVI